MKEITEFFYKYEPQNIIISRVRHSSKLLR